MLFVLFEYKLSTRRGDFMNVTAQVREAVVKSGVLDGFIRRSGHQTDMAGMRRHHEIYLSDPRKTPPERCKTVIRHPVKAAGAGE